MRHYRTITCQEVTCGVRFTTASASTKYCAACRVDMKANQTLDSKARARKKYEKISKPYG